MGSDALRRHNDDVLAAATQLRDEVAGQREARLAGRPAVDPLRGLGDRLRAAVEAELGVGEVVMDIAKVEPKRFGADHLTVKFPSLLAAGGPKVFVAEHRDRIVKAIEALEDPAVVSVTAVGMYVNLRLSDAWLLDAADRVVAAGAAFGRTRSSADQRFVIDYSSPNVAKPLHAGHVRSTIIGDVLGNVLEAAGALVFRVNHINDFGGFGFLLEGQRRFAAAIDQSDLNAGSVELYLLRRTLERAVAGKLDVAALSDGERARVQTFLPAAVTADDLVTAFAELNTAGDARFEALEQGDEGEVALWQDLVAQSVAAFADFYGSVSVHVDFLLGESFYAQVGLELVQQWLESGAVIRYGDADLAADTAELQAEHARGDLTDDELASYLQAGEKDLGGYVVKLSARERFVVLRADGRSIYATRDLAAIALRGKLFEPTQTVYVVGQEQRVHFSRLFDAAYQLGLADRDASTFTHLYFGFYIDPKTRKKLSSRESAAGITQLFELTRQHFGDRQDERYKNANPEEDAPHQLTVASIVFNDLKQDVRSSVEIDTGDIGSVIEKFEKAGGATVIYSACRARSVVVRAGESPLPVVSEPLEDAEVSLLLDALAFPETIERSAGYLEPSTIVRYLLSVSNGYNSYYGGYRVVAPEAVMGQRVRVTRAVETVLRNGLALCNVDCPTTI